ncbi:MAG: formylglycine-generating enzyme family protein [Planctomycetia bacterium]|nr:formylglycine-generating enzyme family protein [Planctomycetia bacterium]
MTDLPGYEELEAEFPFDELIPRIPVLEKYEFGWEEKDLFGNAEGVWNHLRPCVVKIRGFPGKLKTFTVDGIEYRFRYCPPGEFMMGSPSSEEDRRDNETQHRVTLTRGFWMLETEVTQAMWESVMGTTIQEQAKKGTWFTDLHGTGSNYPMYNVSWNDCQDFCRKLTQQISLPTEAQWEYACRAGTTTPFNFGSTLNGDKANCNGRLPYGTSTKGTYHDKTVPVKSYAPNAWGLYDMHGNVEEWCHDWYDEDYSESPTSDPTDPDSGSNRVFRGGSWSGLAEFCRSAKRTYTTSPGTRGNDLGFRLVFVP